MKKLSKYIFSTLDSQPNGNEKENCLTTFIPNNDDRPMWYDRSCIDIDDEAGNEPGHKFMCECNVPDQPRSLSGKIFPLPLCRRESFKPVNP